MGDVVVLWEDELQDVADLPVLEFVEHVELPVGQRREGQCHGGQMILRIGWDEHVEASGQIGFEHEARDVDARLHATFSGCILLPPPQVLRNVDGGDLHAS